ncbi:MAG: TSUP family transporter [Nitrospinae bacterium]|nr:TSUP family transporter [Nitrospinota bacterium]
MLNPNKEPKPFCESKWKLEGMVYLFLILFMLGVAIYVYLYGHSTIVFREFFDSSAKEQIHQLQVRNNNIAFQTNNGQMGNVAMVQVNFMNTIEQVHLKSVVNIKGMPKDGTIGHRVDLGSGVMIHEQGYFLTNYHIVEKAHKFKVTLFNEASLPETYRAKVIKISHKYNLALMKVVSTKVFTPAYMGKISQIKKGEKIFALGNPNGMGLIDIPGTIVRTGQTMTIGSQPIQDLIVVDAKVNWENSGGPLINSRGEAIGICVAIYATNTFEPIYAAIPLKYGFNEFKDVMDKPKNNMNLTNAFDGYVPDWNKGFDFTKTSALFILGLLSGIMSGMLSMGGGLILVSGLIFIFHYGIVLIRPIAYLANFFTSGSSAYQYLKEEIIDFTKITYLLPSAILGLVIGYFVGNEMSMTFIKSILAVFALLVSLKLIYELITDNHLEDMVQGPEDTSVTKFSVMGLPMGFFSGVLGITGGVIEVPLQRLALKTPLKNAIANSSVMVFFTSTIGIILSLADGAITGTFDWHVPVTIALFVIPGTIIGGQIGAYLTIKAPMQIVKLIFSVIMLIISYTMFFSN